VSATRKANAFHHRQSRQNSGALFGLGVPTHRTNLIYHSSGNLILPVASHMSPFPTLTPPTHLPTKVNTRLLSFVSAPPGALCVNDDCLIRCEDRGLHNARASSAPIISAKENHASSSGIPDMTSLSSCSRCTYSMSCTATLANSPYSTIPSWLTSAAAMSIRI
jgi:hypothetical protein